MLKFVKHHLETIAGIEIYPLISLCVFFTFFILLMIYVMKMSKRYVSELEALPLEGESE